MKPHSILINCAAIVAGEVMISDSFRVTIDDVTGALFSLTDPQTNSTRSWIGSSSNAPWQPSNVRWGMGYFDAGTDSLHRQYWSASSTNCLDETNCTSTYKEESLMINVHRTTGDRPGTLTEKYVFKNTGLNTINLASKGATSLAIFTPFNDHYTNTFDALANRAHAHVWAHGGRTAWVKMSQMGGHDRDLGLVLSKGSLGGYSIEGRDATTLSNTRGAFLLHPTIPELAAGEEAALEWTFFWHNGWDDFFQKCEALSEQFVKFDVSNYTVTLGETTTIKLSGARVGSTTTINSRPVSCSQHLNRTDCSFEYTANKLGKQVLNVTTTSAESAGWISTIFLNVVPATEALLSKRVEFITQRQQVNSPNTSLDGAFVLYDNQMEGQVLFDKRADRNAGRERIGMGIFVARWLRRNNNSAVATSFAKYYRYVCNQLQDTSGYVLSAPGDRNKRLYNWPWVLQFYVAAAALDPNLLKDAPKPLDRFILTLENFYAEGGGELYAIGLPILEGLNLLKRSGNTGAYTRALSLFENHGQRILDQGLDYPPFEVNFEQSIVAPAAIMLLELYRYTNATKWLDGAELQLETLLRFAGKQPDYRLHDVAIRHWDGYWFGKDRMWGDVFPHHWSALNAIALHHHARSVARHGANLDLVEDEARVANGIIRSNLALFDEEGRGSCASIYPTSVNQRPGQYLDPYANDQDWALNHLLQIEDDHGLR